MLVFSTVIKEWSVIIISFLGGILLSLLGGGNWFRPSWMVLILLYWILRAPRYINVGVAWFLGIIFDISYDIVLGEHAMTFVLMVFLVTKLRQEILALDFWERSGIVFSVVIGYQFILFLMRTYAGGYYEIRAIFGGALVSVLVWHPLVWLLSKFRIK